jgi:plasmid segregation protein ParM
MLFFTGIDDGNYDIKSPHTTMPAGYTSSEILPPMTSEYLFYNGVYYVPSQKRFKYLEDKTVNERSLVLVLFGIAQELRCLAIKKVGQDGNIQAEISKHTEIALGVGLPPSHMMAKGAAQKKIQYLESYMKDGIDFEYCGLKYSLKLTFCKVFPQDYAAIVVNTDDEIIKNFSKFVAVDIGGGTMDVIPFIDHAPDTASCISVQSGILYMYQNIILDCKRALGVSIDNKDIECVINKERTVLPEEVIRLIMADVQKWVDENIINELSQCNISFAATPVVFLGGGSKLLRPFINRNKVIMNQHYLKDPARANAKGYAALIKQMYQASLKR